MRKENTGQLQPPMLVAPLMGNPKIRILQEDRLRKRPSSKDNIFLDEVGGPSL